MGRRGKFINRTAPVAISEADMDIMGVFDTVAKVRLISLSDITIDPTVQVRVKGLDEATVERYRIVLCNGGELPPVELYQDDKGKLWLGDGFHRYEAHEKEGQSSIPATIEQAGNDGRRAALKSQLRGNLTHGKQLSSEDKKEWLRRIYEVQDEDFCRLSNNQLAKHLGIDPATIGRWKKELLNDTTIADAIVTTEVIGADGRIYDTRQIKEANRARAKNIFTGLTLTGTKTFEVPERYWALAATCRMVGKFELALDGDLICYRVPPVAMGWGAVTPEIVKSTVGLETAIKAYRQMMLETQDDEPPAAPVEPMPTTPNEQKRQLAYLNERLEKLDIRLHNARVANDTRRVDELEEHRRNILEHYARVEAVTFPDKPTPPAEDTSSHEIVLRLIADMEICLDEMGNRLFADWQTYGEKEVSQFRQAFKAHLNGCLEIQLKMKEWWGVY